ncbi:MAG: sugar ABC transporter substrate-binding protein [Bacillota bacterium]
MNWKKIAKVLLCVTLLLMLLVTYGCGQKATAPTPASGKQYTVGLSLASATNPFYMAMEKGIKQKAEELGINIRTVIAEEDVGRQVSGIEDLIVAKVDAILVSPISVDGLKVSYEAAKEAGIPAISIARSIANPELEAAFVGLDWYESGSVIGKWIADEIGGKGKVAMLAGPAGAYMVLRMTEAIKDVLAEHPGIEIVAELYSTHTKENGLRLAEDVLVANPDVDVIYCNNDELALGAVEAVEAAGRLGKVKVTGFNAVPGAVQSVREGRMAMTISLRPESWGKMAMEVVKNVLEGKHEGYLVEIDTLVVDYKNIAGLKTEDLQ